MRKNRSREVPLRDTYFLVTLTPTEDSVGIPYESFAVKNFDRSKGRIRQAAELSDYPTEQTVSMKRMHPTDVAFILGKTFEQFTTELGGLNATRLDPAMPLVTTDPDMSPRATADMRYTDSVAFQ